MRSVLLLLAKREVSLNRRVYSWIYGTAELSDADGSFFATHTHALLVRALHTLFDTSAIDAPSAARPYRVMSALLERDDLEARLLPELAVCMLDDLYRSERHAPFAKERLASARALFSQLQASVVWSSITELLTPALFEQEVEKLCI